MQHESGMVGWQQQTSQSFSREMIAGLELFISRLFRGPVVLSSFLGGETLLLPLSGNSLSK